MKKVISFILCIAMVLSAGALVFADEALGAITLGLGATLGTSMDVSVADADDLLDDGEALEVLVELFDELMKELEEEFSKPISREDFSTYLFALTDENVDVPEGADLHIDLDFTDAADIKDDCYEAMVWCYMNKLILGYGDGKIGPKDYLTREQLAVIVYRYVQLQGDGFVGLWASRLDFKDVDKISDWALEAVTWCYQNGIFLGTDDGCFDPISYATGNEALIVLGRISDYFDKDDFEELPFGDDMIAGGWMINQEFEKTNIPAEALAAYEKASESVNLVHMDIVAYLGQQVVAGTNYLLVGKPQLNIDASHAQLYVLKIHEDINGECTLVSSRLIEKDEFSEEDAIDFFQKDGMMGGFVIDDAVGAPLSERAQNAFDKAFEGFLGVGYEPILELGHQVVAGTNYAVLCKATATTYPMQKGLAIVVIYADLEGGGELLRINNLDLDFQEFLVKSLENPQSFRGCGFLFAAKA